jgi:hypothetical protein
MATTTNYGWTTPDDTALVKDGASAIRTLGSSIDTTVFANASAGIPKTIVDAKGDLIAGTASDTVARLAVGSNDQVLIADSTAATGLKWGSPSAGGMTLISTTTLTGASVTISSIPATYNSLYVVVRNFLPDTANRVLYMRFNADATASRQRGVSSYGEIGPYAFNQAQIQISGGAASSTTSNALARISFPDYANTSSWKMCAIQSVQNDNGDPTTFYSYVANGYYNQTAAISSLSFFPNSGNFTSGSILLYGVK